MAKLIGRKLEKIDPYSMEQLIAELYILKGYYIKVTPKTGDGKKDIIAVKNSPNEEYTKYIESKRYKNTNYIDHRTIYNTANQVHKDAKEYGLTEDEYEIVIVTTSRIRPKIVNKALQDKDVKFVSGDTFVKRLKRYNLKYAVDLYSDNMYEISSEKDIMKRFDYQDIDYTSEQIKYIFNSEYTLRLIVYTEQKYRNFETNLEDEKRIQKYIKKFDL